MVAIQSLVSVLAMALAANAAPAEIVARVPNPGDIAAGLKFFPDGALNVCAGWNYFGYIPEVQSLLTDLNLPVRSKWHGSNCGFRFHSTRNS